MTPCCCEGLVRLLAEDGHQVAAAVGDGPALVEAVLTQRPDASVVDVRMPPTHTDEGCARRSPPVGSCPVPRCWCSASTWRRPTPATCSRTAPAAVGYLLKDRVARVEGFLYALDRVARGATVLDPRVVAQLLAGQRKHNALEALTARERELPELMAQGCRLLASGMVFGVPGARW